MCGQVLTCALNSSSEIILSFWATFKFEIFTLFLHSWLISIFVTNNASRISKLTWKQDAMVAKLLDWSCNKLCLIIGLSRGPVLELGGVASLKVGLVQFALMELGELGPITIVPNLPSIKSCLHLSTFLVA